MIRDAIGKSVEQMNQTSGLSDPEDWFVEMLGGSCSDAGVTVNAKTALSYIPVYQAITMIADDLAQLPVDVFRKQSDGTKEKTEANPIHKLWNVKPNPDMISFDVRQTIMGNALLYGNGIAAIEFADGRPQAVWPLVPGSVTLQWVPMDFPFETRGFGDVRYMYLYTHEYTGEHHWLFPYEVFHIKLFGDGRWGYSPLQLFRDRIGAGIALDRYQSSSFANGARPGGVLKKNYGPGIPHKISKEERQILRREWNEIHAGADNQGKIALLTDGLEYQQVGMSNDHAQMLESMKYFPELIGSIWKIPPHKMGTTSSMTFNNVAEQNRSYVQQCLQSYSDKWEQESIAKLASQRDQLRNSLEVAFDFKKLLTPDDATRVEQEMQYRLNGVLNANEIREANGWDEIQGGDVYLVPSNMANQETGEPFSTAPEPVAPEPPAEPSEEEGGEDTVSEEMMAAEPARTYVDTETMLGFARNGLHTRQALEIKDLTQAMKQKKTDFGKWVVSYYERNKTADRMLEVLEPMANLPGFAEPVEIDAAIDSYQQVSLELVQNCKSEDELRDVVVKFPKRIDPFLNTLR